MSGQLGRRLLPQPARAHRRRPQVRADIWPYSYGTKLSVAGSTVQQCAFPPLVRCLRATAYDRFRIAAVHGSMHAHAHIASAPSAGRVSPPASAPARPQGMRAAVAATAVKLHP